MQQVIKSENGIVLFLVLWVLMLLSVIAGEFCRTMRTEVNVTRNFKEGTQAYYIAVAGLNRAIAEIIRDDIVPVQAESAEGEEEEEEAIKWRINTDIPAVTFGQGQFEVKIENESGKININKAQRGLLRMMLDGFDLEDIDKDVIVDSILDWRDKDDFHRLNGAEDDYYLSLPEPYKCKNGDFDLVEELLLVKGVTPEIFYGGLRDMTTVYQDNGTTSRKKRMPGIGSSRSSRRGAGSSRININAASPWMLRLLPQMTDDFVNDIMEYRKEQDFKSLTDLLPIVGADVYAAISPYIMLKKCSYYTIRSKGTVHDSKTRRGVTALVEIDRRLKNGYWVIRWLDDFEHQGPGA